MKLLLISNSTNYKEPYLGWCMPLINDFLKNEKKNILFFPYAGVKIAGKNFPESYDAYLDRVKTIFSAHGFNVTSVHQAACPVEAVNAADAIMVGGGNTFNLVAEIHRNKLIEPVRRKVMEGTPFLGWSAGSNVACPTLRTTNDMPIVMPESFNCFDFVPFQINPHYIDPYPEEVNDRIRHGGETRQDRINEFLSVNPEITVAGLREASALWVEDGMITLKGDRELRIMRHDVEAFEIKPGAKFDFSFNIK
ncbi:dipeptidase PepE [Bacteroidales bacterium OttesenSCG-928-B11]|nr:dipeptidase PepE [Bacteroidales bacterium OttesenSCG-928-B11]MDL2326684.1 dipeptidase PepE [Bacteroidales bacterium OttesenSCG-928-A14]